MNSVYVNANQSNSDQPQEVSFSTISSISKWGNSNGMRIPKKCMDLLHLEVNDEVEICIINESLVIKKAVSHKKYKNLKERLEDFYQCPYEEIASKKTEEVDWGTPDGGEYW